MMGYLPRRLQEAVLALPEMRPVPFIPEESIDRGVVPPLGVNGHRIHQLGEVPPAAGIPAEEARGHLRRPGELQNLLGAAGICLGTRRNPRSPPVNLRSLRTI